MKAYVTSTDEPTTILCQWALERNGFEVRLVYNPKTSLAQKLKYIYDKAEDDFLRVDADVIVNRNMTPEFLAGLGQNKDIWWWQFLVFDWFKQDIGHQMSYTKKEAIPSLRKYIDKFMNDLRPETEMSRIKEFYEPRRFATFNGKLMGIHGYGISDIEPVKKLKELRGQTANYDFPLIERLNEL